MLNGLPDSFFPSSTPQPSPVVEALIENDQIIADKYPLAPYLPYETDELRVDYVDHLTLRVRTTLTDSLAKAKIALYAAEHDVDLTGHTFVFVAP
jgi:hypothetical protein